MKFRTFFLLSWDISGLNKKYLPRQLICEQFQPLNNAESEAWRNAMDDAFYRIATTFTDQIGFLCNHLRNDAVFGSYERIGKVFKKSRFCILHHPRKFLQGQRKDGRPLSLTREELKMVKNEIINAHSQKPPIYPTYDDILIIKRNIYKMIWFFLFF